MSNSLTQKLPTPIIYATGGAGCRSLVFAGVWTRSRAYPGGVYGLVRRLGVFWQGCLGCYVPGVGSWRVRAAYGGSVKLGPVSCLSSVRHGASV